MSGTLTASAYGKHGIHLLCVSPVQSGNAVAELEVSVVVRAGAEESFLLGDNRRVVTTDALRNLVTAEVGVTGAGVVEDAAGVVARAMGHRYPFLSEVEVEATTTAWRPLGDPDGSRAFCRRPAESDRARVTTTAGAARMVSGWCGPALLMTGGSRFVGFVTDELTPNQPQEDRAIAGDLFAEWELATANPEPDHAGIRALIRSTLLTGFGQLRSESVQHLLTMMCTRLLAAVPDLRWACLRMESTTLVPAQVSPAAGSETLAEPPRRSVYLLGGRPRATTSVSMRPGDIVASSRPPRWTGR